MIIERSRVETSVRACVRVCVRACLSLFRDECLVGIAVGTRHRGNDVSVIPW